MTLEQEQIDTIREFNRFYTARLGLLRKTHLDGEFSLTEARILFETNLNPNMTARQITEMFHLDAGYVSRTLANLAKQGLIVQTRSTHDGREKQLSLTEKGREKVAEIDRLSAYEINAMLACVRPDERTKLVESFATIRQILLRNSVTIMRVDTVNKNALDLIHEYYEAINVVVRDTPEALQKLIDEPGSGLWIAYLDEGPAGVVILRPLPSIPGASECKRLYVCPWARGRHIADRLMDALEQFAAGYGYTSVYLDTYDDLKPAISLYEKRGYERCERYNDNPQATVFMAKQLAVISEQ